MGKRSRRNRPRAAHSAQISDAPVEKLPIPRAIQREISTICDRILEKCSQRVGHLLSPVQEWKEYLEIESLVTKIQIYQLGHGIELPDRADHFGYFVEWLTNNGVDTSAVQIHQYGREEYGLKAMREIKANELVLSVPRSIMMTTETAAASFLGDVIQGDKVLSSMPNVVLSLHLLAEAFHAESRWRPYLNVLPKKYTTPLYFDKEDLEFLKGTQVLGDVLNQYRNIARQYAYLYKLFQGMDDKFPAALKNFCYDDYRWAVSTVMTRQNLVPGADVSGTATALIPLWDMSNHCHGTVYIFYGTRSNSEFLVHNGFVYPENHYDRVFLRLGLSKNDALYSMRAELLSRLAMMTSRLFRLNAGDTPVDSDLLAFLRVFTMDTDALEARLTGPQSQRLTSLLKDVDSPVDVVNEKKAWSFLKTRVELLIKSYPTTIQGDMKILNDADGSGENVQLTTNQKLLLEFRLSEKQLLSAALKHISAAVERWEEAELHMTSSAADDLDGVRVGATLEDFLPDGENDDEYVKEFEESPVMTSHDLTQLD